MYFLLDSRNRENIEFYREKVILLAGQEKESLLGQTLRHLSNDYC